MLKKYYADVMIYFKCEFIDSVKQIGKIKAAANNGDVDALSGLFAELRALQQPKFVALHNVINELISPTREKMEDSDV